MPLFQALKTEITMTLITLDQWSAFRRVSFHLHDCRASLAWTVARQSIGFHECVHEKSLVTLTKRAVVGKELQYLFVVDDLIASGYTVDRTSTTGFKDIRLKVTLPTHDAMLVPTG